MLDTLCDRSIRCTSTKGVSFGRVQYHYHTRAHTLPYIHGAISVPEYVHMHPVRGPSPVHSPPQGANAAHPGDSVVVHPGVYRERVAPPRSGEPGAPIR